MALFLWMFKNLLNQNDVDLPVKDAILGELNKIDEETTIKNLVNPEKLLGRRRKKAGRKLIAKNIGSVLLNKILSEKEKYGIDKDLVDKVRLALATI
jgi:hypothetical protein